MQITVALPASTLGLGREGGVKEPNEAMGTRRAEGTIGDDNDRNRKNDECEELQAHDALPTINSA